MADLRDEHGNPIQLTDGHGNPVQLTDEHGNPVYVTGVATKHPGTTAMLSGLMGHDTGFAAYQPQEQLQRQPQQPPSLGASGGEKIQRSNSSSSSSSSSEDDGKGGRRKKGLKEKVKEKLSGVKFPEEEQSGTKTEATKNTYTTTTTLGQHPHGHDAAYTTTTTPGQHPHSHDADRHEKKSVMEKIKEKLPGHHGPKH
ncbi:hypothetical protein V6N13_101465 [Hibiscus sabdariffa]|uniref:Uncharacterized protein n=1 Tax=Hibiscus sabdariffa TaxID=183260 RepID=A0ABR2QLE9_9ROSI